MREIGIVCQSGTGSLPLPPSLCGFPAPSRPSCCRQTSPSIFLPFCTLCLYALVTSVTRWPPPTPTRDVISGWFIWDFAQCKECSGQSMTELLPRCSSDPLQFCRSCMGKKPENLSNQKSGRVAAPSGILHWREVGHPHLGGQSKWIKVSFDFASPGFSQPLPNLGGPSYDCAFRGWPRRHTRARLCASY